MLLVTRFNEIFIIVLSLRLLFWLCDYCFIKITNCYYFNEIIRLRQCWSFNLFVKFSCFSDSQFVLPWATVPLKLSDLTNLKLCGLGKPEKKSYEWMIPKNVKVTNYYWWPVHLQILLNIILHLLWVNFKGLRVVNACYHVFGKVEIII